VITESAEDDGGQPSGSEAKGPKRPSVALVLGAGGARGLAHIGVIDVLRERGYRIAAIAGSSMGALVGGICAAGKLADYRDWACALERGDVMRLLDFAFGHPGLIKGDRVIAELRRLVGEHRIEELETPFVAVATDLASQREVWMTRGKLFDAVRASIAIPMVFTPHRVDGRELVDGGLLAPIPIAATRMFSADLVMAVDANSQYALPKKHDKKAETKKQSADKEDNGNGLRARIEAWIEGLMERGSPEPAQPGLLDLMSRSLDAVQSRISQTQLALDPPDVRVRIPHQSCFFYEFWKAREMIEIGREAAELAIDQYEDTVVSERRR
jgi:NTE family protein